MGLAAAAQKAAEEAPAEPGGNRQRLPPLGLCLSDLVPALLLLFRVPQALGLSGRNVDLVAAGGRCRRRRRAAADALVPGLGGVGADKRGAPS